MLEEGLHKFIEGRSNPIPFKGKYAVKRSDFFTIFNQSWRGDPNWAFKPLKIEFEITNKCNDSCSHCGMGAIPVTEGRTLGTAEISRLIDQCAEIGIPSVAVTGGEPFVAFRRLEETIRLSRGRLDVAKITTNGFWGRSPGRLLDRLEKAGFLDAKLFVPLLFVSVGEQTTPLEYVANIVNHVVTNYKVEDLQIGLSSLHEFGAPDKLAEVIRVYERRFGEFPHHRVHLTRREYLVNNRLSSQASLVQDEATSVEQWMKSCYSCFAPTVGAYVLPNALLKFDGSLYTCACFNVPERLRGGNLYKESIRDVLERINSDTYVQAIRWGDGLKGLRHLIPQEAYANLKAPGYCDACSLLGDLFDGQQRPGRVALPLV